MDKDHSLYLSADLESDSLTAVNCSGGSGPSSSGRYEHNVLHLKTLRFLRAAWLLLPCRRARGRTCARRNNHSDNYSLMPNRLQLFKMCIICSCCMFLESHLLLPSESWLIIQTLWLGSAGFNSVQFNSKETFGKRAVLLYSTDLFNTQILCRLPQGFMKQTRQRD